MTTDLNLPRRPRYVTFNDRSFTAEELQFLASLPSIAHLNFTNCRVGDNDIRIICGLPKLERLWLEGTQVTDAILPDIAQVPNLNWLVLDHTQITGAGFAAFSTHTKLRILYLCNTLLDDAAMPLLAQIPRISIIRLEHTKVTGHGLLALAAHRTVKISAGDQFTEAELREFEIAQRRNAKRTPATFHSSPADQDAARSVLLDFFAAMTTWERDLAESSNTAYEKEDWNQDQCVAIFAKYCTPKERKYGRPNALSFSSPPQYEDQSVLDTEWLTPQKVFFYTKDRNGFQHRYLIVKKREAWLVDHVETLLDGWEHDYL